MDVTVVGSGSWGSAVSRLLSRRGHRVQVLTLTRDEAEGLARQRENPHFLPGVRLPDELGFVAMSDADLGGAELLVYAVPTQAVREVARWAAPRRASGRPPAVARQGLRAAHARAPVTDHRR